MGAHPDPQPAQGRLPPKTQADKQREQAERLAQANADSGSPDQAEAAPTAIDRRSGSMKISKLISIPLFDSKLTQLGLSEDARTRMKKKLGSILHRERIHNASEFKGIGRHCWTVSGRGMDHKFYGEDPTQRAALNALVDVAEAVTGESAETIAGREVEDILPIPTLERKSLTLDTPARSIYQQMWSSKNIQNQLTLLFMYEGVNTTATIAEFRRIERKRWKAERNPPFLNRAVDLLFEATDHLPQEPENLRLSDTVNPDFTIHTGMFKFIRYVHKQAPGILPKDLSDKLVLTMMSHSPSTSRLPWDLRPEPQSASIKTIGDFLTKVSDWEVQRDRNGYIYPAALRKGLADLLVIARRTAPR